MKKLKYILIFIIICTIWGVIVIKATHKEPQIVTFIHHTVQEGDTLWDIAQANPHDGMDIREFIYDLERMNGITPQLEIDSEILIPVYEDGE